MYDRPNDRIKFCFLQLKYRARRCLGIAWPDRYDSVPRLICVALDRKKKKNHTTTQQSHVTGNRYDWVQFLKHMFKAGLLLYVYAVIDRLDVCIIIIV